MNSEHMKYSGFGKFGLYSEQTRTAGQGNHVQQRYHQPKNAISLITELGSESNAHGLAKIVTSGDTKRKVRT